MRIEDTKNMNLKVWREHTRTSTVCLLALFAASAIGKRAREDAVELGMGGASDGDGEGISADELISRDIERR